MVESWNVSQNLIKVNRLLQKLFFNPQQMFLKLQLVGHNVSKDRSKKGAYQGVLRGQIPPSAPPENTRAPTSLSPSIGRTIRFSNCSHELVTPLALPRRKGSKLLSVCLSGGSHLESSRTSCKLKVYAIRKLHLFSKAKQNIK